MAEVLAARRQVEARVKKGLVTYDAGMGESPLSPPLALRTILADSIKTQTRYGKCVGTHAFQKWAKPSPQVAS